MTGDAEDDDGERMWLFVGQVPRSMAEEEILAVDRTAARANDATVIHDYAAVFTFRLQKRLGPAGPDAAAADCAQRKHAAIATPPATGLLTEEEEGSEKREEKDKKKKRAADM
ncbi:hypothetical protein [Oryza sativa Japonica Group]|uniref:Uncharacterized protein n=1 Tax=Oryza sativa subsp. japonica TaxID=39947 RepID=Q5VQV1_ORYSJ|nr:hypothetical protein [Oryza sativa Japonica Group]